MVNKSLAIISVAPDADESEGGPDMTAEVETRLHAFDLQLHGKRLDVALQAVAPEFSRSYLQQRIEAGDVSVNGRVVTRCASKVKLGDSVLLHLRPTAQSQAFRAEQIALDIVYEDEHLLVVNKPAGMVVHPAPGNWSGTLMNALLWRDAGAFEVPRAGIVHRLDKDTSGLMVVARNRLVMDRLVQAIALREVKRQYLALVHGAWRLSPTVCIDKPIGRDPANRLRMAVVDLERQAGKMARTDVQLLDATDQCSLLGCSLHTGRTHQIRVHLASLGYPLVADALYGGRVKADLRRQALHARHLAFDHPLTGRYLQFSADLPGDMQAALETLSLRYNPTMF